MGTVCSPNPCWCSWCCNWRRSWGRQRCWRCASGPTCSRPSGKRYSSKQKANLQADYDELWQEFDARDVDANFVALQAQSRKPLEEIASKKRAIYRRRYEWLDLLVQGMAERFARQ